MQQKPIFESILKIRSKKEGRKKKREMVGNGAGELSSDFVEQVIISSERQLNGSNRTNRGKLRDKIDFKSAKNERAK